MTKKVRRIDPIKRSLQTAFDLAAKFVDTPDLDFWSRFGELLIERASVRTGDRVIDVCCGSGAVTLAAARRVGKGGRALGIDLSAQLIARARENARAAGLTQAKFVSADIESLRAVKRFDVATCGFALFFFDDMPAMLRRMSEYVRPEGRVAVSVWGEGYWEPFSTLLDKCITRTLGLEGRLFNRSAFKSKHDVGALLAEAGLENVQVTAELDAHPVKGIEGWWRMIQASGYQSTLRHLSTKELELIKLEHFDELEALVDDDGRLHVPCPVYLATGRVPDSL